MTGDPSAPRAEPTRRSRPARVRAVVLARPTTGGLLGGLLFWWQSLAPTLLPRSWVIQAAISAISAGIGYALGTLATWALHLVLVRVGRTPGPAASRSIRRGLSVLAVVAIAVGLVSWLRWQDEQRELVELDSLAPATILPLAVLTVVLLALFGVGGRLVGACIRKLDRWNRRHLPALVASPVTILLVVVLAVFVGRDLAFARFTSWAGTTFSAFDAGTNDGTEQPRSASVSGSPDSLVPWDTLGLQGRDFVAGATPRSELEAFHDTADVGDPIRVYAGLRSADSVEERAELAVDELERTGAFDQDVLVVATSTGTGWIDPDASEAIEQLHGGRTAIVSMQYSYLPSWISFITDLDLASAAGAELYGQVYDRWSEEPEDDRPELLVFGLSLGSFGAEAAFAGETAEVSVANLVARSDGALLVGAVNGNPILQQLTADRDPGSPVWAPVFDGGTTVRFRTRDPEGQDPPGPWDGPRVLYFQHPTDPVTYWSMSWLWSSPEWMDHPRGYDVTDRGRWFPVVTWVQGIFDLMAGFSAPPGFGHDYRLDYVDGWSAIAAPDGWTDADTERLEAFLFDGP